MALEANAKDSKASTSLTQRIKARKEASRDLRISTWRMGGQDMAKPYKWPYKWVTGCNLFLFTPISGVESGTWRIIPLSRWLITMVIVSPQDLGLWDPFHMVILWRINGGY